MKESQNVPVWLKKMVLAQHNCTPCGDWLTAQQQQGCAPAEKSVINWI
jgi:hypothetical protein